VKPKLEHNDLHKSNKELMKQPNNFNNIARHKKNKNDAKRKEDESRSKRVVHAQCKNKCHVNVM
jgi:hypothetical protein